MAHDHGMQFWHKDLKKLLMLEVSVNRAKYKDFYSGSFDNMLTSLETYLTYGVYSQEVVDIAVLATAKVLCVNMCIFVTRCFWGAKGFWTHFHGDATEDS